MKLLRPAVARRPEVVARFLREARAAARVKSEHVCRVSDVALEGKDLAGLLRARGPPPSVEVVDLVLELPALHRDAPPLPLEWSL